MRAAVAFPGRGSYGPPSLGSLPSGHPWVRRADELRAAAGLQPLAEIDGAERFDPSVHLRPSNALAARLPVQPPRRGAHRR